MSGWDAKVTRVDQPEPGLLALSFRDDGRTSTLLLVTLPGTAEIGVVEKRPRGASASPSLTKLRRHVEGARIEHVERSSRALRVSLIRGETRRFLIAAPSKPGGAWWLCDTDGGVIVRSPGAPAQVPDEEAHLVLLEAESLRALGDGTLRAHQEARRSQLERLLGRQIKRLNKKKAAISADLERAAKADELREKATLLLSHATTIPKGATHLDAPALDGTGRTIRIALQPPKSAPELAQALFAKSKRLRRGLDVAPERLRAVTAELEALEALRANVGACSPKELEEKLEAHGIEITEPRERERKRRQAGGRVPYRAFVAADGTTVLVGRGAADNDRLTLRVARPHDLWLHARGVAGAHVVVRLAKGKSCSAEALVDAATLAAHFSDVRGEPVVDVLYTPRRFVRKRKGSPVGSVTLEREKVMAVRLEPKRLERLLGSEKKSTYGDA